MLNLLYMLSYWADVNLKKISNSRPESHLIESWKKGMEKKWRKFE